MKRTILVVLASVTVLLCGAKQANAEGITYTDSGNATGTIGAKSFFDVLVTLTLTGETSNVTNTSPGFFQNTGATATVTIGGLGTFAFTNPICVFDNQGVPAVGISELRGGGFCGADILDTGNSAFATYDLTTAIGPITGDAGFNPHASFATAGGLLNISSVADNTTTFTGSVPEPSSLMLLLVGLVMARRRLLL